MPCPACRMYPLFRRICLQGKGCWQLFLLVVCLLPYSSCIPHTAGCCLTALEFTRPSCFCRHRVHKAGVLRASEGAAPASRGGIAKASSSSGRAYTSSGGLPPQQPHTCHSCGVEMGSASRYSRKSLVPANGASCNTVSNADSITCVNTCSLQIRQDYGCCSWLQHVRAGNLWLHVAVSTPQRLCTSVCLCRSYLSVPPRAVMLLTKFIFFFAAQTYSHAGYKAIVRQLAKSIVLPSL